jgi:hypothetical protein
MDTICGWKIDPNIFVTKTIFCGGTKEDGTTCGTELSPHVKFCITCDKVLLLPDSYTSF